MQLSGFVVGCFFFFPPLIGRTGQEHGVKWVHTSPDRQVIAQLGALKWAQPLKDMFFSLNQKKKALVTVEKRTNGLFCKLGDITTKNLLLILPVSPARSFDKGLQKNQTSSVWHFEMFSARTVCSCLSVRHYKKHFLFCAFFYWVAAVKSKNVEETEKGEGNEAISINSTG